MNNLTKSLLAATLLSPTAAVAGSFMIDFQGTGGTTAAGAAAFENTNQVLPNPAGITYTVADQQAAGGSDVGSDIIVTLSALNLPNGNLDFRAVERNGALGESVNDWIGVDSREGGTDVTLTITVSGLLAGEYSWLSNHHDGGTGVANGNQMAPGTFTFDSAGPDDIQNFSHSPGNGGNMSFAQFATNFTSDGSPVSLSIAVDDTGAADFGFINDFTITQIPEPSGSLLALVGAAGLLIRRRR